MKYNTEAKVISERNDIKEIIFGKEMTIIWGNNTATVYTYKFLKNIGDARMVKG